MWLSINFFPLATGISFDVKHWSRIVLPAPWKFIDARGSPARKFLIAVELIGRNAGAIKRSAV